MININVCQNYGCYTVYVCQSVLIFEVIKSDQVTRVVLINMEIVTTHESIKIKDKNIRVTMLDDTHTMCHNLSHIHSPTVTDDGLGMTCTSKLKENVKVLKDWHHNCKVTADQGWQTREIVQG